jgi:lysozyme
MATAQNTVLEAISLPMSDWQYAALADFVFNVGSSNFRTSTLLRVINAGDTAQVAPQLRRWVFAGGKLLRGLQTWREREIELFFEGQQQPRGAGPEKELPPIDIRAGEKH